MLQAVKLPVGGLLANALHIVQFASEDAAPLPGEPPFTPLLEHERHAGGRALVAQEARPFRSSDRVRSSIRTRPQPNSSLLLLSKVIWQARWRQ